MTQKNESVNFMPKKNPKGGNPQGGQPARKREKLKFYPSHTNQKTRKILGENFVKMEEFKYFFRKNIDGTTHWRKPISVADMFLNLEDDGLQAPVTKVKNLLASDSIEEVTPLHLIHEKIAQKEWDGVDRVSEFVHAVNLQGDRSTNEKLIRKWLANTYTLAFTRIDPLISSKPFPRVVLIFHSEERKLGKSSIVRWLGMDGLICKTIPQLGQDIYSELQAGFKKDDRTFDIMLANSLLINFDDVGEFFMKYPAELRAVCTQTSVQSRELFTGKLKTVPRRAGLVGTTNNSTVLRDPDENRYAVFTLKPEGVKWSIMDSINPLDIWRQARAEAIKLGDEVKWSDRETDIVKDIAQAYLYKNPLEEFVDDHFEFDHGGDMKFLRIKEIVWNIGFMKPDDKSLRHALDRLVPMRQKLKRVVNGYSMYSIKVKNLAMSSAKASDVVGGDPSEASEASEHKIRTLNV